VLYGLGMSESKKCCTSCGEPLGDSTLICDPCLADQATGWEELVS